MTAAAKAPIAIRAQPVANPQIAIQAHAVVAATIVIPTASRDAIDRLTPRQLSFDGFALPEPARFASIGPGYMTIGRLATGYITASTDRMCLETVRTYNVALKAAEKCTVESEPVLERDVRLVTSGWAQLVHDAVTRSSGGATADKLTKLLSAAWRHAANRGATLPPPPWSAVERHGSPPPAIYFGAGWLRRLLDVVDLARDQEIVPARACDFYTIGMHTALRPWKELLRLRWEDIDDARGLIVIRSAKGRHGGIVRTIPIELLGERGKAALARQRHDNTTPWVWPGHDGERFAGKNTFGRWWPIFRDFANTNGVAMEDLKGEPLSLYEGTRHAMASHCGELGLPQHVIQQFLGHRRASTTARYTHLDGAHLIEPARLVSAGLRKAEGTVETVQTSQRLTVIENELDTDRLAMALDRIEEQNIPITKKNGERYETRSMRAWLKERDPPVSAMCKVAAAVGVRMGWLFGEGPDELPEAT